MRASQCAPCASGARKDLAEGKVVAKKRLAGTAAHLTLLRPHLRPHSR